MQVTGYKIRRALKELEMLRDAALVEFNNSFQKYKWETKESPQKIMEKLERLEGKIARLQAAQALYNTQVMVDVVGKTMTLSEAVKRVGSFGKMVGLWKNAANQASQNTISRYGTTAKTDDVFPEQTITSEVATANAIQAEKYASALRGAVAEGNTTTVDLEGLDPDLLRE